MGKKGDEQGSGAGKVVPDVPIAIPLRLIQPNDSIIPLEPLQREGVLQENREIGLAGFEPTTSDRGKEKPIPDEGDGSSF